MTNQQYGDKRKAIIVRMTPQEKINLDAIAKRERMSVSGFIKWLIGKFERGLVG